MDFGEQRVIKDKRYFEGCELLEIHKYNEAEDQFRDLLAEQPDHFEAINKMGVIQARRGNKAAAKQLFDKAIALAPDYAPAWSNLGNLALEENNLELAWSHYEKSKACDDEYPFAYYGMALVYKRRGEIKKYVAQIKTYKRMQRRKLPEEQEQFRIQFKRKIGCLPGMAAFVLVIGTSVYALVSTLS